MLGLLPKQSLFLLLPYPLISFSPTVLLATKMMYSLWVTWLGLSAELPDRHTSCPMDNSRLIHPHWTHLSFLCKPLILAGVNTLTASATQ